MAYETAAEETGALLGEESDPDEMRRMEIVFAQASRSLRENGDRPDPSWSMEFGFLARVVAYERDRMEFEDAWERMQSLKARR